MEARARRRIHPTVRRYIVSCSARWPLSVAALVVTCLSVTGCGGSSDSSAEKSSASSAPLTVTIIEKNGTISPDDGHVVDVHEGQEVQLIVTTDAADEIHVHSIPEHEFEVAAGASADKLPPFALSTPGRFVIESHVLDVTLVTLQVS
jgi:hypothetical protein